MKKTISLILVAILLIGCVFSLASCSTILMGTYESKIGGKYEFGIDGKVTYTALTGKSYTGTYEIEKNDDGELEIEFDFENDVVDFLAGDDHSFTKGEENGTAYIKIGGIRYDKVK